MLKLSNRTTPLVVKELVKDKLEKSFGDLEYITVLTGSRVAMTHTEKSDYDIYCFSDSINAICRLEDKHHNASITLAGTQMLLDDSLSGEYGGFFAAKLINPYIIIDSPNEKLASTIIAAPSQFVFPYLEYFQNKETRTKTVEQLTALAVYSRLKADILYRSWWASYFNSSQYNRIWDTIVTQFESSMREANIVFEDNVLENLGDQNITRSIKGSRNLNYARNLDFLRHWTTAFSAHENDFSYLDWVELKYESNLEKTKFSEGDSIESMINHYWNLWKGEDEEK